VAVFAITNAPADAACLQITVVGSRTVVKSFSLSPGQDTIFTLTGLPVGAVVFSEQAFAQDCSAVTASSVATWVSDPVPATITPGVVAQVMITLHRNGEAVVSTNFDDSMSSADGGTGGDAGGPPPMCAAFYDDSTLPLLGPGGVRPPLP
jgi:hypothetical protein